MSAREREENRRHTVLVVVGSAAGGHHLLDVVRLLESDPRVNVLYTTESDRFARGVERLLQDIDAVVVPWPQARTREFGLVLATGFAAARRMRSPSLVIPFGEATDAAALRETGHRVLRCATGPHGVAHRAEAVPSSIAVSHRAELRRLTRAYPETRPVATVAGDPSHDRLAVSVPLRAFYRRVLGVGPRQRLVAVVAAPGRQDLLPRLLTELPPEEFRVIALSQPDAWYGPAGPGLADCLRRGLSIMPPECDWRSALVAADWIIDEDGRVAPYGAVTGVPVLLSGIPDEQITRRPALAELSRTTPWLSPHRPVRAQLGEAAGAYRPDRHQVVLDHLTSEPGRFNRNIRSLVYRLLRLSQPARIPTTDPVSPPFRID